MSRTVFLDAGPLGILTNPRRPPETVSALRWALSLVRAGHRLIVPAIADFEVRRELERAAKTAGLAALDAWNSAAPDRYLPLSDSALRLGAKLWARARNAGTATAERIGRRRADRGAGAGRRASACGLHHSNSKRRAPLPVCPR